MITNYISLTHTPCVVSVVKDNVEKGNYDLRFDCGENLLVISVKADFLKKIANVLRAVTYPMHSEERVKVCLNATVSKSLLENMESAEKTSVETMATFLKSLRVEDLEFAGTSGSSGNSSPQKTIWEG